jgi:hypothetical protein
MTREIIEVPVLYGVSLDQIKSALASFSGCVVDHSKVQAEEMLFVECQAEDGWAVRERLESIKTERPGIHRF